MEPILPEDSVTDEEAPAVATSTSTSSSSSSSFCSLPPTSPLSEKADATISDPQQSRETKSTRQPVVASKIRQQAVVVCAFAFVAGVGDVMAVLTYQTFTSTLTGNIVYFGGALGLMNASSTVSAKLFVSQPAWYYAAVTVSNLFGSFATSLIQTRHKPTWHSKARLIAVFSFITMIAGAIVNILTGSKLSVMLFAAAYGAQNTFTSNTKELSNLSTTAMTGNFQKLAKILTEKRSLQQDSPSIDAQLKDFIPVLLAIASIFGALFASLLARIEGFSIGYMSLLVAFMQMVPYYLTDLWFVKHDAAKQEGDGGSAPALHV